MPPRLIRRLVFGPAVLALVAVLAVSFPVTGLIALAIVPFVPGRWRPLRVLWFMLIYLAIEAFGLVTAFLLWIASGFGWKIRSPAFLNAHYAIMRLLLGVLVKSARRTFNLTIAIDETEADIAEEQAGRPPIIVLARHAGPGDSFLLVATLLSRRRRPRIVLKAALQWDPFLDVMLNRLPCRFIPSNDTGRAASIPAIAKLAGSMGPDDAFVIFPEGGNFTEKRRHRSIVKLEEKGLHEEADLARRMRHVLAPRTNGTLAAIQAAPDAEILLVAHTGLEDLSTLVDLWRGLPMDSDVRAKAWRVYPGDMPKTDDEQKAWLYEWWLTMDTWIVEQRGIENVPDEVAKRVAQQKPQIDFGLTADDIGA